MNTELNRIVILKILESIPKQFKPVNYLMDSLGLSQISVYRRLKGEIPFTFEEIYKLSLDLDFSLDEITDSRREGRVFIDMTTNAAFDSSNAFLEMLEQYYYKDTLLLKENSNSKSTHAQNRVPVFISFYFEHLYKFFYYKWMHQFRKTSLNFCFSDMVIPPQIIEMQQKISSNRGNFGAQTYILNQDVYLNIIKEIQYYYKRKLITKDEFILFKNDLYKMVQDTEKYAQNGINEYNETISIYLSNFDIESNSIYAEAGDQTISFFYPYTINPMIVRNSKFCAIHKEWLDSLKKYSIFISQSNEALASDFFGKQYQYIENIDKIIDGVLIAM